MNQNQKQISQLIHRLRQATTSRTWSTLPEDLVDAANALEQLQTQIADRDATINDLEERLSAWNTYKTEIDQAILTQGSYKP